MDRVVKGLTATKKRLRFAFSNGKLRVVDLDCDVCESEIVTSVRARHSTTRAQMMGQHFESALQCC